MGANESHHAPNAVDAEIEEIRRALKGYTPGKTVQKPKDANFPTTLFIGMFGRTGSGKTSLINSLRYAADGSLREGQWLQTAGQGMAGGHTMYRHCIGITEHVTVVDNRGVDTLHAENAIEELLAQLAGKRGYSSLVKWTGNSAEEANVHLDIGDRISTAVFVISALHNVEETIEGLGPLVSVLHSNQGQYPVVVITHVDVVKPRDLKIVRAALIAEGISESCIFTVANVTTENKHLSKRYQLNMLRLLDRCMTDGDRTMVFHHHKTFESEKAREREEKIKKYEAEIRAHFEEQERLKKGNRNMEQEFIQRLNTAMENLKIEREDEIEELKEANKKAIEKAVKDNTMCLLM